MDIGSAAFALFLVAALAVWHISKHSWRPIVLALINAAFLASFFVTPQAGLPILVFAALGWGLLHWVARRSISWGLAAGLTLILAIFVVLKKYSVVAGLSPLTFAYTTVGLSYILFRILHLAIDIRQGAIAAVPGPLAYFNYLFFFLTFVAGPIQRFQDHRATLSAPADDLDAQQIRAALLRIIDGLLKVVVVAAVANDVAASVPLSFAESTDLGLSLFGRLPASVQSLFQATDGSSLVRLAGRFLLHAGAFVVYLTVNFYGYMDIVIGAGRLFGVALPENFNRPFAARNFLDFWSRWHITLSEWFKFYVFNPLLKSLASRWGRGRAAAYLAVVAFFVTFILMGLWHGTTPAYWIYGLLLGGGVSLNKLYQVMMQRRLGKARIAALGQNRVYAALCRGAMASFFTLALACLWLDAEQLAQFGRLFGGFGLVRLFLLATLLATVGLAAWDWATSLPGRWSRPVAVVAFYGGFLALAGIWGNLFGLNAAIESALGFGLPDPMKAAFGGMLVLFAWDVGRLAPATPPRPVGLAMRFLLLVFVGLTHAGAVPDFVYKGF